MNDELGKCSKGRHTDMTIQRRAVMVKQLPEKLSLRQRWIFFREIENYMNAERPRLVLDCTNIHQMDRIAIHVLLRCLEEAMKRNGDVKLAAIPREALATLERIGAIRLFEVFHTTQEAVNSFHQAPMYAISQELLSGSSPLASEQAA